MRFAMCLEARLNQSLMSVAPPLYAGDCRLLDWKHGARLGMTVDLALGAPGPDGAHPFRMCASGREMGQRFKISISFPAGQGGAQAIYDSEGLLLRWNEGDRTGMMIRFQLDDGPDGVTGRHPFFGLAVGVRGGELLFIEATAIAEDERLIAPSKLRRRVPFHQLSEVTQSSILARDPRFQNFLWHFLSNLVPIETQRAALADLRGKPETFATAVVRLVLGVSTRSVMNGDSRESERARHAWRDLMGRYHDNLWARSLPNKTPEISTSAC